jgi:hypothetical protein
MNSIKPWIGLVLTWGLLAGCSSTTLTGSWKNPDYTGQVQKVYIVGMAKQDIVRRILEDEFKARLSAYGVTGLASYKDLPDIGNADEARIAANIKSNVADAVLMTNVTDKRTEKVVTPGRISSYDTGPYYDRGDYYPPYYRNYGGNYYPPYYRNYGSYYNQRRETIYEPATVSHFEIITVEATLYDTSSNMLIWSAQLETVVENNIQTLVNDFVEKVIEDMHNKGLI